MSEYLKNADVWSILDLIVTEFTTDPNSVACFDLRIVDRAKQLVRERAEAKALASPHTKANPGPYDCYAKLRADEPYFVLRAKDPDAPATVERWANARAVRDNNSNPKIEEARETAQAMREWRLKNIGQAPEPVLVDDKLPLRKAHGLGAVETSELDPGYAIGEADETPDTERPGRRW